MTNKPTEINGATLPFSIYVGNPESLHSKHLPEHHSHRRHSEKHVDSAVLAKSLEILNHKVHDKNKAKKLIRNADLASDHPIRAKLWLQLANLLGCNLHKADAYEETLKMVYGDEGISSNHCVFIAPSTQAISEGFKKNPFFQS